MCRHSGSLALIRHSPLSNFSMKRPTGLPRTPFGQNWTVPTNSTLGAITIAPARRRAFC